MNRSGSRANRLLETLSAGSLSRVSASSLERANGCHTRRALETAETGENRRLLGLIREIQQFALSTRGQMRSQQEFFALAIGLGHSTHSVGPFGTEHTRPVSGDLVFAERR